MTLFEVKNPVCEMTMSDNGRFNGREEFWLCGKPAKAKIWSQLRQRHMFVCGVHARAHDKVAKRFGRDLAVYLEEKGKDRVAAWKFLAREFRRKEATEYNFTGLCSAVVYLFRYDQITERTRQQMLRDVKKMKPEWKEARRHYPYYWPLSLEGNRKRAKAIRQFLQKL